MASSRVIDKDTGFKNFFKALGELDGLQLKVGINEPEASIDRDGISLGEVALVHEMGGGNVPQRSFVRATVDENIVRYSREMEKIVEGTAAERFRRNRKAVLQQFGNRVALDMKKKIAGHIPPPLTDATIAAKTGPVPQTPLVDTGMLIQSITAKVSKK